MTLLQKLNNLKNILRKMQSVVIAYSGGVDSSLLLKVAKDVLKENVLAVIAASETYPETEIKQAERFAKKLKAKYLIIKTDELKNPNFKRNPLNRCFFCKEELFSKLKKIAQENNLNFVVDGSNFDDLKDFRPGSEAAKKLNVRSPLKEARLTKDDIRQLSKRLGLSIWNKPSFACLSSRFPYGMKITKGNLKKIQTAEEFLRNLGFKQVRLRHHKNIARIEVPKVDLPKVLKHKKSIIENLKILGYTYICVDLEGYRSGSMNEGLAR
ncbi:MAG: ATP-dependent sacrificial sulfur transferase LarE [Candidatus Omnitrophota bacterium]|nr:ATP-dependent sacrificial sulfur transferase LarE [Candidatus Omnitrophota bacterium]